MDAWAKYTNAHGGINGHPIKLVQLDDQLNAALALTQVKQLVQQDHVMALVGVSSIVEDAWASYIASGQTPVIGDDLAKDVMEKYKNFFPQGATRTTGYFYGMPKVAAVLGQKKYGAIYCAESTACSEIAASQKQQAAAAGVSYGFSASVAAAATSYTAQCLAAKAAGVGAVGLLLSSQVADQVAAACAQQGFNPQWLQAANGFSQKEVSDSALNNVAGPVPVFPWFSSATPAMKEFQDAMHAYEPQDFSASSDGYSGAAAQAWAAAKIFQAAAEKLPAGSSGGAALMAQLYQLPKNDTFGGLTPPISYANTGGPQPSVKCFFMIQLKGGTYTALNNTKPFCAS
jgi:branched-chain amino acid transport system substrate-binding protein